jgi:hypothetical protein
MDLQQLQRMGAFVPKKLFKRDVEIKRPLLKPQEEWADPEVPERTGEWEDATITVYIRRGSSADALEIANAAQRERPFVAVYRSICDEHGKPLFPSLEDAMQLDVWLAFPLFKEITAVTQIGEPKNSQPRMSSGARSHSPSAAARSKSGNTRSTSTNSPSGEPTEPSAAPSVP